MSKIIYVVLRSTSRLFCRCGKERLPDHDLTYLRDKIRSLDKLKAYLPAVNLADISTVPVSKSSATDGYIYAFYP